MYLTKEQIASFVEKIGQPEASVLLNKFFNSYRKYLNSNDVAFLYDKIYLDKINSLETYIKVNDQYRIHVFNKYSYNYLLPKLKKSTRILDIGCGSGDFAMALASHGVEACVGLDFSKDAIQQANLKLLKLDFGNCTFLHADILSLENDIKYDYVVLNDVIEHLSNDELKILFEKIHAILPTSGEVVIHTPNGLALCNDTDTSIFQLLYKFFIRIFFGWKGHERTVDQLYYEQTHINIKSYSQLKLFLKKLGYRTKVFFDEKSWMQFFSQLSTNMLVIAKRK